MRERVHERVRVSQRKTQTYTNHPSDTVIRRKNKRDKACERDDGTQTTNQQTTRNFQVSRPNSNLSHPAVYCLPYLPVG
eukprot:scaffold33145_cov30-Attheya_sp.AAC.1